MGDLDWVATTLCTGNPACKISSWQLQLHIYVLVTVWILHTCTWVRASWIELNNCSTRCDLFGLLHFCRQLYMFRVLTAIISSWYSCNYSFWYWLTGSTTIHFCCWVGTDSCVSYGRYSFVIHMHNKWIPTVWYTWISSNSTMRADGSRSGYVKTILFISIVLLPK